MAITYVFEKITDKGVVLTQYDGSTIVQTWGCTPNKDVVQSPTTANVITIAVQRANRPADFIGMKYTDIDWANCIPAQTTPTDINEAITFLMTDFFFEVGGGGSGVYVPLSGQNYVTVPTVNTGDYATDIATNAAAALAGLNEAIDLAVNDSMGNVVLNLEAGDYEELVLPANTEAFGALTINGAGKYETTILSLDLSLWEGVIYINDLQSSDFIFAAINEINGGNCRFTNLNSTDVELNGRFENNQLGGTWCDDSTCNASFLNCPIETLCPNGSYHGEYIKGGSIAAFCSTGGVMQQGYLENVTIEDMTGANVMAGAEIRGCTIENFLGDNGYLLGKVIGGKVTAPIHEAINVSSDTALITYCDVIADNIILTDDVTLPIITYNELEVGAISATTAETAQIGWNNCAFDPTIGLPNITPLTWDSSNLQYQQ